MNESVYLVGLVLALVAANEGYVMIDRSSVNHGDPRLIAFRWVIRVAEGTSGGNGYREFFGGSFFTDMSDHPRQKHTAGGYTSTAAGAYQFVAGTWDMLASELSLTDFSPASQDAACDELLRKCGAYAALLRDDFAGAVDAASSQWASLPGSLAGQHTQNYDYLASVYTSAGGAVA